MKQSFETGHTPSGAESTEKISEEEKSFLLEEAEKAGIELHTDEEFRKYKKILETIKKVFGVGSSDMVESPENETDEVEKSEEFETGALESQPLVDRIRALVDLVEDVDEDDLYIFWEDEKGALANSIDEALSGMGLDGKRNQKTHMGEWHALMGGSHEAEEVSEEVRSIVLEKIGEFVARMETELPKKAPMSSVA